MAKKKLPEAHENRKLKCKKCTSFKKCKRLYDIHELSRACIKYNGKGKTIEEEDSDIELIRQSSFFIKLRDNVKTKYKIKKSVFKEVLLLHSAIKGTTFNHRFTDENKDMISLSEKLEKNQSYRDRLTEISITVYTILNGSKGLYWLRNLAKGKIYDSYSRILKEAKNMESRDLIVSQVVKELDSKIARYETLYESAEMAIKNLDQAHWTMRAIVGIGEQIIERRRINVGKVRNG